MIRGPILGPSFISCYHGVRTCHTLFPPRAELISAGFIAYRKWWCGKLWAGVRNEIHTGTKDIYVRQVYKTQVVCGMLCGLYTKISWRQAS